MKSTQEAVDALHPSASIRQKDGNPNDQCFDDRFKYFNISLSTSQHDTAGLAASASTASRKPPTTESDISGGNGSLQLSAEMVQRIEQFGRQLKSDLAHLSQRHHKKLATDAGRILTHTMAPPSRRPGRPANGHITRAIALQTQQRLSLSHTYNIITKEGYDGSLQALKRAIYMRAIRAAGTNRENEL